jgi:hypothetical protein
LYFLSGTAAYATWLPFIATVCLHFLDAERTYSICAALLSGTPKIITSRYESWSLLLAFDEVARAVLPEEHAAISKAFEAQQKQGTIQFCALSHEKSNFICNCIRFAIFLHI